MRTLPPTLRASLACGLAVATLAAAGCTAADAPTAALAAPDAAQTSALVPGVVASIAAGGVEAAEGIGRRRGAGRRPIACNTPFSRRTAAVVGPEGGTLTLGDVSVRLPPGAVDAPQHFTLEIAPGRVLAVRVHATGHDHFQFRRPISITVGYERCGAVRGALTAWHVDGERGTLLEHMGGVTDPATRTHSFATPHLSVYVLAN